MDGLINAQTDDLMEMTHLPSQARVFWHIVVKSPGNSVFDESVTHRQGPDLSGRIDNAT